VREERIESRREEGEMREKRDRVEEEERECVRTYLYVN
jgi:hypothetical protein